VIRISRKVPAGRSNGSPPESPQVCPPSSGDKLGTLLRPEHSVERCLRRPPPQRISDQCSSSIGYPSALTGLLSLRKVTAISSPQLVPPLECGIRRNVRALDCGEKFRHQFTHGPVKGLHNRVTARTKSFQDYSVRPLPWIPVQGKNKLLSGSYLGRLDRAP